MTHRFALISSALAGTLLAVAACAHAEPRAAETVNPPPFIAARDSASDEPTGAIASASGKGDKKNEDTATAPPSAEPLDANQRLAALELDMAAIKIELSRISEFDSRLTELEGGAPHSATKLEPIAAAPPPPKLKVPEHAGDAPLPVPSASAKKTPMPDDLPVPASVAALEPITQAPAGEMASAEKGEPAPVAAAAKMAAPASPAASGDYGLQLAAYSTAAGAAKGWSSLTHDAGTLLSDLTPRRAEASIPGQGTVYRLKAGPFANAAAATQRCASLKAEGHACLVTDFSGIWP